MRTFAFAIAVCALAFGQSSAEKQVTWTGWFADTACAGGRVYGATVTRPNPECARKCIEGGSAPVFISEQAKSVFKVKDYPTVLNDLGYRLEVTARADETARSISVQTVKRISEYEGPSCARPRPSTSKKP